MALPYLNEVQNASKKYSVMFRGLNYGEGTQDGEFAETQNISTDQYPCITQRAARVECGTHEKPVALHSKGKLLIIKEQEGTELCDVLYDGNKVGEVAKGKKQMATVGNYIVIFPDKMYYKVPTEDDKDGKFASMEETFEMKGLKFTANKITPNIVEIKTAGLKFASSTIESSGTVFPFEAGDIVTISGCEKEANNKTNIEVLKVEYGKLTFAEGTFPVTYQEINRNVTVRRVVTFPFEKGDSVTIEGCSVNGNNKVEGQEIIVRGVTADELTFDDSTFTAIDNEENLVTIKRSVPPLDFICESNYRLWGTHGNTIYASKYSQPLNFKSFEGLAGDSYAIEVASEGEFTGCIPYSSHICFFKENTLHKLYGSKPSNFQVTTANVYGVQAGSEKSMQIVNEQLLYKGVGGVYAYTGGVPELISENFGTKRFSDAVACCDGEKYYISMKNGNEYSMFTYDVLKNIWLREDDTQAVDMTFYDGKVYYLDADGGLFYIDKEADRNGIEWQAQFCTINETMNERKGYSKFHLRMDLDKGAWLAVDVKTDNEPQWKQVFTTHNSKARTVSIPIMPTRCDSVDIRLRGKGKCTIKTFIREFTVGSDV